VTGSVTQRCDDRDHGKAKDATALAACDRGRFRLVHYSVQGDHAHLIVEATTAHDLACGLKAIAARFARSVNRVFGRKGPVLADRAHVHVLRTPREVRNAIAYVLLNARRHAANQAPGCCVLVGAGIA
jgi:hypothetical protein